MIKLRPAHTRGHTQLGWLDSYHTFSFGEYYDPQHMGFRQLRVINDDRVKPGAGFGTHSHRDMEILTYVLEGALEHKDSLGTGSVIYPNDVQRMTAGTGISHSEYNASQVDPVHFLQIWMLPEQKGLKPGYEQRTFPVEERRGQLRLIASRDGREGAVTVHQDVDVFATLLAPGERITHRLRPNRHAWVQVARGAIVLNGHPLKEGNGETEKRRNGEGAAMPDGYPLEEGDGAAISGEEILEISADEPSEILLFDLA